MSDLRLSLAISDYVHTRDIADGLIKPVGIELIVNNLSFEQAAAVPISGLTALQALRDTGKVQPGQQVLIVGAAATLGRLTPFLLVLAAATSPPRLRKSCSRFSKTWRSPSKPPPICALARSNSAATRPT